MAALVSGKYITSDDLLVRLTPTTYLAIFDDNNAGQNDLAVKAAVQQVIDLAEGEVDSYLLPARGKLPLPTTTNPQVDRLLKGCALDYAQALSYERHPEYVRTYGDKSSRDESIWKRAESRMKRIKAGMQELPDIDSQNSPPRTVGGVTFDQGPRTITDSSDGTENGDGF